MTSLASLYRVFGIRKHFRGQKIRLRSFPWAKTPMAFLVKEAA
jgi:hypothetical protein